MLPNERIDIIKKLSAHIYLFESIYFVALQAKHLEGGSLVHIGSLLFTFPKKV
jgi:hypothetical protein